MIRPPSPGRRQGIGRRDRDLLGCCVTALSLALLIAGCPSGDDLIDFDGDGYPDAEDCGPEADDTYPGAPDYYGNGVDENCDGADGNDDDGDGFASNADGEDQDCDDNNPNVNPGADESIGSGTCNDGFDNDCDDQQDSDDPDCVLADGDGDGYDADVDCDDADPSVNPGAAEDCDDGIDNDCDEDVDSGDADCLPTLTAIEGWDATVGTGGSASPIEDVEGLASDVPSPSEATRRFVDAWRLLGARLDTVNAVELRQTSGGSAIYTSLDGLRLESGGTATERTLLLPPALVAGGFDLVLLADAGEMMAHTFVLRGEASIACWDTNEDRVQDATEDLNGDGSWNALDCQGPPGLQGPPGIDGSGGAVGPPGVDGSDGADGRDGADGADGSDGSDRLACWDRNGDGVPTLPTEDSNGDGVVDAGDCRPNARCPEGFARDASETGFVLCYDPDSNGGSDEMVQVGDFWVDRYESSVWANDDCTGTQYGGALGSDDYPSSFPDTGAWTQPLYACSISGVTPSRMLTWFQAQQSCNLAGKELCSNEQWQAAAAGTPDPGSFDGDAGGSCNTSSGDWAPRQVGLAAGDCTSAWGADDMIGNLWEWAADWRVTGLDWQSGDGESASSWLSGYGGDRTWNMDGRPRAYNNLIWVDGLPAATLLGGAWYSSVGAGVSTMYLGGAPSYWSDNVGFRCCRSR